MQDKFDLHQSEKLKKLIWFLMPALGVLGSVNLTIGGGLIVFSTHALSSIIMFSYLVIRCIHKNKNMLYEATVISTFIIIVFSSVLVNSRVLPKSLNGVNPLKSHSSYEYQILFYAYSVGSVVSVRTFIFCMAPLFLLAEYFYYSSFQTDLNGIKSFNNRRPEDK